MKPEWSAPVRGYDRLKVTLTPTHILILHRMSQGMNMTEIARQLRMSSRAVHQQMEAARRRTGCRQNYQLIAIAAVSGLLGGVT